MTEAELVENHATPYTKLIFSIACIATLAASLVYYAQFLKPLRLPFAYFLLVVLAYIVVLGIALYRQGTSNLPVLPFMVGTIWIVGGIAFDVIVTIIKTPTLSLEYNPVARQFFESGLSIEFVYLYGITAQAMFALLICVGWAAFLRHRKTLIELAWQPEPKTFTQFINAALTGRITVKPRNERTLSDYLNFKWYRFTFLLIVSFLAVPFIRLYFGLEWLGIAPFPRSIVVSVSATVAVLAYFIWLWREYSKTKGAG